MSFIPNLLGMGGSGMNFKASGAGNMPTTGIVNPIDISQANMGYNQAQHGVQQNQNFLNALSGANMGALQGQNQLASQLQGVASGTGPNPALAQLANSTGQNVASQAAMAAGQRGAGANVGLMARNIGQQGAGIQQQAAGQAASLGAQQQLGAMGQLQNLYGTQVSQQQAGLQGYNQAAQAQQNALLNSIAQQNQANVGMQSNINNANAGIQGATAQGQSGLLGGVIGGVGAALGMAQGGEVKHFDMGGSVDDGGSFLSNFSKGLSAMGSSMGMGANPIQQGMSQLGQGLGNKVRNWWDNQGGTDGGNLTPTAPNRGVMQAKGGVIKGEHFANSMKPVPGKAKVDGDSLKNDTVPAMLSPGEVVIPRHIMQSEDPSGNAAKFVQAIMAKHGMRRK